MSDIKYNPVPEPPCTTALNSSLTGEKPRTLWMGDLDPLFNESTLKEIWKQKGFNVKIKLIKNKKNLLIPCSNKFQKDNFGNNVEGTQNLPTSSAKSDIIEINGMKFVDPTTTSLHHSGYCFVEFETFELASKGLRLNTTPISNFQFKPDVEDLVKLDVINQKNAGTNANTDFFYTNKSNDRCFRLNWASSTTLSSPSVQTPEYSMFVGDLRPETTEIQVMVFFQKNFKSVKTVRIMTDPVSGKSRCFGFVRFGDKDERETCVKTMNGVELNGKPIKCALAAARAGSKQNMIDTTDFRGKSKGHGRSKSHDFTKTGPPCSYGHRKTQSTSSDFYSPHSQKFCLFVKGLNKNLDEGELFTCFQKIGKILKIKTYSDKGCAFIDFDTKEDALKAIDELDGYVLSSTNAPIKVSWSRDSNQEEHTSEENLSFPEVIPQPNTAPFNKNFIESMDVFSQDSKTASSYMYQQAYGQPPQVPQSGSSQYFNNYNYQYQNQQQQANSQQQYKSSLSSNLLPAFIDQKIQTQSNFSQSLANRTENSNILTDNTINRQPYYNNINPLMESSTINRRPALLNAYQEGNTTSNELVNKNSSLLTYLRNQSQDYSSQPKNKGIWED